MNYPVYYGMMDAFQLPGPANMSSLVSALEGVNSTLPDPHALGIFIENHDLARFANTTVDPQLQFTALAFQFVIDGIPIVYYGQEQGFTGIADPVRAPRRHVSSSRARLTPFCSPYAPVQPRAALAV